MKAKAKGPLEPKDGYYRGEELERLRAEHDRLTSQNAALLAALEGLSEWAKTKAPIICPELSTALAAIRACREGK